MLDIGCNGGFYSIEMKRRGADRVLASISTRTIWPRRGSPRASRACDIEFRQLSVYDVGALGERFDIVLFMGVLYHLRHPLLALDLIREHVVGDLMVFQSMQRGSADVAPVERRLSVLERGRLRRAGTTRKMHFIEHSYAGRSHQLVGAQPGLRRGHAAQRPGFEIVAHPEAEVYVCRRAGAPAGEGPVYPAGGGSRMIEAAMIWNEPNNKSHWDPELDPDWRRFARDGDRGRPRRSPARTPHLPKVLGGISPIDPSFIDQHEAARRARPPRCRRGARLSARLEPLADRRVAGEDR